MCAEEDRLLSTLKEQNSSGTKSPYFSSDFSSKSRGCPKKLRKKLPKFLLFHADLDTISATLAVKALALHKLKVAGT